MTRRLIAIFAIALALGLAGCGSGGGVSNDPPKGSNASTDEEATGEATTEAPKADPKFGQAFTYEDDLSIKVSTPEGYKPTSDAYVEKKWPHFVVFEVTLVNGTKGKIDPTGLYLTLQSNDVEAEQVFATGLEAPETTVLPGRQVRFKAAFGVDNPDDLVMDVDATVTDFFREPVTFVK
ncbi:MAG: hypothetical protein M3Q98_05775 [Actinomycetota bacterium]|nr:hypothetical protein [Actinomycetota bacterium]